MNRHKINASGFSLIEVTVASAILGVLLLLCLEFLAASTDLFHIDTAQTDMEAKLQNHLDAIILELKEASPTMVKTYDYTDGPGGLKQTAILLPTARQYEGEFKYKNGSTVSADPIWQGVVVYAFYAENSGEIGSLVRYADYGSHNYNNSITVTSITSSQIVLSDGTVFQRNSQGASGSQYNVRKMDNFAQMVRVPEPPSAVTYPLTLKLVAQKELDELSGDVIQAESSTGIMSRNKN